MRGTVGRGQTIGRNMHMCMCICMHMCMYMCIYVWRPQEAYVAVLVTMRTHRAALDALDLPPDAELVEAFHITSRCSTAYSPSPGSGELLRACVPWSQRAATTASWRRSTGTCVR